MSTTQQLTSCSIPYVGLSPTGKTGALNVCLQLLFHSKDFVVSLVDIQNHNCPEEDLCLWCSLYEIVINMSTCTGVAVKVDEDFHDNFFGGHNGDTYGYLLKVLCRLSHEFKGLLNNNYDSAPFIQAFDVALKRHETCIECGLQNIITSTKISIDVPIGKEDTVAIATLSFLLHNEPEKIWCDKCLACTNHIVVKSLQKNPKLLCIKLLRFEDEGIRNKTPLKLSESLILPSGVKYNLLGSALHFGDTLLCGQSMMLLKCPNGSFKLIGDSNVKNVAHESVFYSDVIRQASYMVLFERHTTEACSQDPNVTHVSLDMSTMAEQISLASVENTSMVSERGLSASISTQGSWIVSPIIDRELQTSQQNALKCVKRVLNFTENNTRITPSAKMVLSPISEEVSATDKSATSPHQNMEHNDQGTNNSFLNDDGCINDSATSYVSNISPVPFQQVPCSAKRRRILHPRALDMDHLDRSDDISIDSANLVNKSGPPPPSTTRKPTSKSRRLRKLGLPPTIKVNRALVSYETCCTMPEKKFKFFTGLTQYHFNVLFDLIGGEEGIRKIKYVYGQKTPLRTLDHRKFSSKNRLFLMLIRMRRGVPIIDLAHIFGIGKTHCGAICYAMIRVTYEYLHLLQPHMFISAEQQKKNMPAPFRRFKNLRVIIDCVEFHIEKPSDFQQQGNTFSSYKHCNTEKYLIGTSSYGSIIFCSDGFEGNKSDKEILKASGIMNYLERGDSVMADRGFNVKAELAEIGVDLIKPSDFKKKRQFLNPQEEILTKDIATARIYVEHVMKSIKDWRILRNIVPMSVHDILPDMVFIAAYLTNFNKPFIKLGPGKAK